MTINAGENEQMSGGWEYDGPSDQQKGHSITCPFCGNSSWDSHGESKTPTDFAQKTRISVTYASR